MYAKLVSNVNFNPATGNAVGDRLKDISDIVTGVITSSNITDLVTFDHTASLLIDTVPAGWSVMYTSGFGFGQAQAGSVVWTAPTRLAGRSKFFKLSSAASTTLVTGYTASDYTASGVATNEANIAHTGWALSTVPVLFIKVTADCVLFYAYNNDNNPSTAEPDIVGVIERTTFSYDATTYEAPQVYIAINNTDATTGSKVPNKYNPTLDSYTAVADLSARFKLFATTGNSPSISRDSNGKVTAPFIPLSVDDYPNGWIGGSISEYGGFYRSANDLGRANDVVTKDSKNYRVWAVGSYRYLVEES